MASEGRAAGQVVLTGDQVLLSGLVSESSIDYKRVNN